MTRDEILNKAAQAIARAVGMERPGPRHLNSAAAAIQAVEDDIRRDERNRITAWVRQSALTVPQLQPHRLALMAMADELDRRPIEEE